MIISQRSLSLLHTVLPFYPNSHNIHSLHPKYFSLPECSMCLLLSSLGIRYPIKWSNPSILKEINPEYSLEGQILKLKLQYFGHMMQRADSLEKTLMLGKRATENDSKNDMSLSKLQEIVKDRETGMLKFMRWQRVGHDWATAQQQFHIEAIFFQ